MNREKRNAYMRAWSKTPKARKWARENREKNKERVNAKRRASARVKTMASWEKARRRCHDSKSHNWKWYGGRGIQMCERWRTSFSNFLADMGERPAGTTLDRFPNKDGDYEPGNCRWATWSEQQRNTTKSRFFTHGGATGPMVYWSEVTGIKLSTLWRRYEHGWSFERIISQPVRGRKAA